MKNYLKLERLVPLVNIVGIPLNNSLYSRSLLVGGKCKDIIIGIKYLYQTNHLKFLKKKKFKLFNRYYTETGKYQN